MQIRWRILSLLLPLVAIPMVLITGLSTNAARSTVIQAERRTLELISQGLTLQISSDYSKLVSLGINSIPFYQNRLMTGILTNPLLSMDQSVVLEVRDSLGEPLISSQEIHKRQGYSQVPVLEVRSIIPENSWVLILTKTLDSVLAPLNEALVFTLVLMVTILVVAVALALFFSHQLTKPLVILADAVGKFGAGDLSQRAPMGFEGEIGVLATQFNAMAGTIARSTMDLEHQVQERTKALNDSLENLQATQAQLVASEKLAGLGSMVAGFAHELNTPLGVVVTTSSYLVKELEGAINIVVGHETVGKQDFLRKLRGIQDGTNLILQNLMRSTEMVDRFKMVAADQHVETQREIDLHDFMVEIADTIRAILTPKSVELVLGSIPRITFTTYPGILWQILSNLARNAVIHAFFEDDGEKNRTFRIAANSTASTLILTVSDNGRGIPEDSRNRIFEPFFTTKRHEGSTGLGLHIVYNLVTQKMGGTISLGSSNTQGASFIIELPLNP